MKNIYPANVRKSEVVRICLTPKERAKLAKKTGGRPLSVFLHEIMIREILDGKTDNVNKL